MARGFCRAAFRVNPENGSCLCDRGQACHAALIYRSEAINAVICLEKEGFTVLRRDP